MQRIRRFLFVVLAAAGLAGCASGPKYADAVSSFPALQPGHGRIWFYRSGIMFGAGIQPDVMLNGTKVGDSVPGGFFFVDRPPGNYEVLLSTEVERKVTFTLEPRQERYVRMTVGLGVVVYRVFPELADPVEGDKEIRDLSYIGGDPKKK